MSRCTHFNTLQRQLGYTMAILRAVFLPGWLSYSHVEKAGNVLHPVHCCPLFDHVYIVPCLYPFGP